jgi:lipoprotein-anchoring transpeptidase ErfK/SrfK
MFSALARRLAPVLAVLFGMLAFSVSAEARRDDRLPSGFEVQLREHAQVRQKAQIRKKAYLRKHAQMRKKAYVRKKALAYHRAQQRIKAQRLAHAGVARPALTQAAEARSTGTVEARIDLKSQRMVVKVNGEVAHVWKVSTARKGFVTPRGVYSPKRMHVTYFSKKYYNSPMPYSIFFKGGYAVHGTGATKALGAPASHGCIRLATGNARTLYQLVKQFGPAKARIVIT